MDEKEKKHIPAFSFVRAVLMETENTTSEGWEDVKCVNLSNLEVMA